MPIITKVFSGYPGRTCPNHVQLFATPWTAAHQASLSFTMSQSLLKLMSIDSVMPSNHLSLCCPLLLLPSIFPASGSLPMSWLFASRGQSIRASASALVLPMNIQGWFPLGLTGLISLLFKGLSRVFSNTTVQKHQLFSTQPSSQSWEALYSQQKQDLELTVAQIIISLLPNSDLYWRK